MLSLRKLIGSGLLVGIGWAFAAQAPAQTSAIDSGPLARLLAPQADRDPSVRDQIASDVAAYQAMAPAQFLQTAQDLIAANRPEEGSRRNVAKAVAAELLVNSEPNQLEPATVEGLYQVGVSWLNSTERETLQASILSGLASDPGWSYEQLNEVVRLASLGRSTHENGIARRRLVADWLGARDVSTLETAQLDWCQNQLRPSSPWDTPGGMRVAWTGTVTAPRTGAYEFSTCPLDPCFEVGGRFHRQAMRVSVDGQMILDTEPTDNDTAADWVWRSTEVSLQADQPVSLRVEYEYAYDDWEWDMVVGAPLLAWRGPGAARQIISPSTLRTPTGEQGLLAEYAWTWEGTPHTYSGVEPNLDVIWRGQPQFAFENRELRERSAEELLGRMLSAESFAGFSSDEPGSHPFCGSGEIRRRLFYCLEVVGSAEREAAVRQMSATFGHWAGVDSLWKLLYIYRAARPGAEEVATDLILGWASQHPDYELYSLDAESLDRVLHNREACRGAAIFLTTQYEGGLEPIEAAGLEDAEGNCNLAIACVCAYGHRLLGDLDAWIEMLDERLADGALQGDRRVNWLIARSLAEEIHGSSTRVRYNQTEPLDAGVGWLEEAAEAAVSAGAKQRVARERAVRLLVMGEHDASEELLTNEADRSRVDHFRQLALRHAEDQPAEQKQAYLLELERRQERAASRGDSQGSDEYGQLLDRVKPAPE